MSKDKVSEGRFRGFGGFHGGKAEATLSFVVLQVVRKDKVGRRGDDGGGPIALA